MPADYDDSGTISSQLKGHWHRWGDARGFEDDIRANPGEFSHPLIRVFLLRIDGVIGAESARDLEPPGVYVYGDNSTGTRHTRVLHGQLPHKSHGN